MQITVSLPERSSTKIVFPFRNIHRIIIDIDVGSISYRVLLMSIDGSDSSRLRS
jgi:hypothetical protein